jgi:hypothetical protein
MTVTKCREIDLVVKTVSRVWNTVEQRDGC